MITRYRLTKSQNKHSAYYNKYYPTFYFDDGTKPRRVLKLANSKKREAELNAIEYMDDFNRRVSMTGLTGRDVVAIRKMDEKISNLLDEYIKETAITKQLRETTVIEKKGIIERTLKPFYQERCLAELNHDLVVQFMQYIMQLKNTKSIKYGWQGKELSDRRRQKFWEVNKTFINWLREKGYIKDDPTYGIHRPKNMGQRIKPYWTLEDFSIFLEVIPADSQERALFMLAFFTGMRQGEILGLTWRDIQFDTNDIIIDKQWCSKTQKVERVKTRNSVRKTKMPDAVKEELLLLKARQLEYGIMTEERILDRPVFINGKFEHLSAKTLSNHMADYIAQSGVRKISFHQLRDSFITNTIDRGIHADVVKELVGHKDTTTTLNVYKRTTEKHKEQAMESLNQFADALIHKSENV